MSNKFFDGIKHVIIEDDDPKPAAPAFLSPPISRPIKP
jgi:hypothetical protein